MANLEMSNWTNPRNKEVRIYINNWAEVLGFETFRSKSSGRITEAKYKGKSITNAEAGRNLAGKVYIIDKTLYMDGHSDTEIMGKKEKAQAIRSLLSEQGIEIENTKYIGW